MKTLIYITVLTVASFSIAACNSAGKSSSAKDTVTSSQNVADQDAGSNTSASIKLLVVNYLQLKNALATDNTNDAATAGIALAEDGFVKFSKSALTSAQKKSFEDIADDAREMAEHIGKSAGKLPHQREHFDMLSKDMIDLVKLLGAGMPLYVDHCPMYNDKKGADWLSETKEIRNPYMGSGMSTCGTVIAELQ